MSAMPTPPLQTAPAAALASSITATTAITTTTATAMPTTSEEHPDPELDRQLAIAIANQFTPAPVPSASSAPSTPAAAAAAATARRMCTHSSVGRVHDGCARCHHCGKVHWFGWVYSCQSCGYRACHNCRPKFGERCWLSFGVLG